MLDIKSQRDYKFEDNKCRRCMKEEEKLCHVINCGYEEQMNESVITNIEYDNEKMSELKTILRRIGNFLSPE